MRVAHRFHGKSCSLDGVIVPLTRKRSFDYSPKDNNVSKTTEYCRRNSRLNKGLTAVLCGPPDCLITDRSSGNE